MGWKELHYNSTVIDLHTHAAMKALLFDRDLSGREKMWFFTRLFKKEFWPFTERVTFKGSQKGGLDLMLATSYVPEAGWARDMSLIRWLIWLVPRVRKHIFDPTYFDATINMMDRLESEVESYNSTMEEDEKPVAMITSVDALQGFLDSDAETRGLGIIHCVEGAHSLHGALGGKDVEDCEADPADLKTELMANLQALYDRGVAYITLAHFFQNHVVHPVFPYPEYALKHVNRDEVMDRWDMNKGLTEAGKEIVEKMLELGMLIDICHCTPVARKEIYDIVDSQNKGECLMSTHTGVFEMNPDPYNLEDWELKWMADHGCVVGCIFMNYWLSQVDTGMGLKYIERTLNHMRDIGGADLPAIGTDFDGFTDPPDEIINMEELPRLTKYLMASQHFSDEELVKILGGNSQRILLNGWKKSS